MRWMNPKPLLALNHFTVPCSILLPVSILISAEKNPGE
jgi:hypothetical protein